MPVPRPGEVWQTDLGMQAKVRHRQAIFREHFHITLDRLATARLKDHLFLTLPKMFVRGTAPQKRLSFEFVELSPSTK
jgi:hypothetical protein